MMFTKQYSPETGLINKAVATGAGNKVASNIVAGRLNLLRSSQLWAFVAKWLGVVLLVGLGVSGWGQILTFDFNGLAGNEATANSNSNNANLSSSTISRGSGITATANGDRFNSMDWTTSTSIDANDYVQFIITPNSGFQFSVSSIVVQVQRSGTGPRAIALRNSLDGYAANLGSFGTIVDNTNTQTFTFTFTQSNSTTAVTYRLYMYNAEAVGGTGGPGDGTGNDITVNGAVSASAINYYWNGGNTLASPANGGTGTWNTTNAWRQPTNTGAQATWANGNIANFAGTAGTVTLSSSQSPASTVIAANGYTFATGGATTMIWEGPIDLGANSISISPSITAPLSVTGVISGTGGITKISTGVALLSGDNTYTGPTTINAGSLNIAALANGGNSSPIGASANTAGNLVLGGGTLVYTGSTVSTDRAFTLTSGTNSTINVSTSSTILTIGGAAASSTGSLTKAGNGTLVLSGNNAYTGSTTISAGTLRLGATGTLPNSPLGTNANGTSVTSGAVLDLNGFTLATAEGLTLNGTGISSSGALINSSATAVSYSGNIVLGSNSSIGTTGNITLSGIISGGFGLTKVGAGTLAVPINQTYTGKTVVSAGTWSTSGESSFGAEPGAFTADQITFSGGATLLATGGINFSSNRGITLGTGEVVFNSNGNTITVANVMTGSGAVNKTGTGTLRYDVNSGTHAYTGTTTLTTGTLQLERDNDIPDVSNVILAGGTLQTGRSSDGSGRNETAGTLQLTSNSTIALGTGNHSLNFSNSSGVGWTAGQTLTITGWTGTIGVSGTAGKVFVGTAATHLTSSQKSQITFDGFAPGVTQLSTGEIVPTALPISTLSDIIRSSSFTEPENIAYQNFQTTNIPSGSPTTGAIKIGEFTIRDGGGASDADGLSTILSSITFSVSNHTNVRRLALYNGTTEVGTEQAGAAAVTFTGLNLTAPDNGSFTFDVYASFNTAVTDNQQIQLTVTAASVGSGSSSFAASNAGGAATSTTSDRNRIEVTATRLVFVQQPSNTAVLTNMTPTVTVSAVDAAPFGNTDQDYGTSVTLSITTTTCGTLTGNTATPSLGVASFGSLQGTVAESGLTLTAASGSLTSAVSGSFNFTNAAAVTTTLALWNFTDQNATVDQAISANSGKAISVIGGVTTLQFDLGGPLGTGNGDYAAWGSQTWVNGSGLKWWQIDISSTGYQLLQISSQQRSSGTGPRDFKLQYRIGTGGIWTDVTGGTITVADNFTSGTVSNLSLPAACDNQSELFIRWLVNSNTNVDGNTMSNAAASSRIDNIVITGIPISAANNLYYQTKATGNFENPCTWETSTTGSAPWTQAAAPPDFSAQTITILNGHNVSINADVTLDQVVVDAGGTLSLNDFEITWNNGTGVDFIVNGTYIDNASSANSSTFGSGATWQLGSNGTFVKTRNSSSTVFRDNYEGGMSTIPSTANWILRYTGASDVSFTSVSGTVYPNLTFENSSGVNPYTFTTSFSGSSSNPIILGNLDIGGTTYTNGVIVQNINTNATPLTVNGNLTVRSGSTFTNAVAPSSSGTGFDVKGNVTVEGTLTANGANSTTGILQLTGTAAQTISGGGVMNLNNFSVWNSTGVNLSRSLTVDGIFGLALDGTLNVGNNTLTLNGTIDLSSGNIAMATNSSLTFGANAASLTLPNFLFLGTVIEFENLTINRAGGVALSNQDFRITGALTLTSGTFSIGSRTLVVSGSLTRNTGTLTTSASSNLSFGGTAGALTLPNDVFAGSTPTVARITMNRTSGVTLGNQGIITAVNINLLEGALHVGNNTLTLNGTVTRTNGTLTMASSSSLSFGANASPVVLPDDFFTSAPTFENLTINRAGGVSLGNQGITTTGALTLTAGAFSIGSNTLGINGSLTRSAGTMTTAAGSSLSFGPNAGALTLPNDLFTATPSITNFTVNRAGGVTLGNQNISVTGNLGLTNGILTPGGSSTLTLTTTATTSGGSVSSFVNGPLYKQMTNGSADIVLPVGKTGPAEYQPVTLGDAAGSTMSTFSAEYFAANGATVPPRNSSIVSGTLLGTWQNRYWQVNKSGGDMALRVGLPYTNAITEPWFNAPPGAGSRVGVARFAGSTWDFTKSSVDFNDITPPYFETRIQSSPGVVYSDIISSFSPFTIGHGLNTILPVTLLRFEATLAGTDALLQWQVAPSATLSHFVVEHSINGQSFAPVQQLAGQVVPVYSYRHTGLTPGTHYYRLKVAEKDGSYTYSATRQVTSTGHAETMIVQWQHSGPGHTIGQLTIFSQKPQAAQALLIDMAGRVVKTYPFMLQQGLNNLPLHLPALASGIYRLRVTTSDGKQKLLPVLQ